MGRLGWAICLFGPIGLDNGRHVLGNEKVEYKYDQGYAYYGEVRLGHLFILAL